MSMTIDQKVVEMTFNNKNFEANVSTSLSTLDKLKKALKLDGASKGLEDIQAASKKVNLQPMSDATETVTQKFSYMQMTIQHQLDKIVDSAVETGKRLVSSLSVDQITAGWTKYEQKTASVQTIMNATGKSIDEVNAYLNKLMWFSDETSYGFTDMTSALGQLTSAGGDIDDLIPMITGIANATAHAGKGATEFSRAIYNLNQSYSAGYLQYMDWKSLELAGVASEQLKQTFIDIGVELGKIKKGEVTIANFGSTLSDMKWADTSVMEAAFGKYAELSEAAYEAVQSGQYSTASEAIEALSGNYDDLAVSAFKSAQEAKSFTEAIEATKDAVSSGWMTTFELIFGNYEEAKVVWTDLANTLWDIFASGGETRNEMLGEALNTPWKKLTEGLEEAGISVDSFESRVERVYKSVNGSKAWDRLNNKYESFEEACRAGAISSDILKTALGKLSVEADENYNMFSKMGKVFNLGAEGDDVKKIQKSLQELGYEIGEYGADGKYGKATQSAIKAFQEANGLLVDGIIGPKTLAALDKANGSVEQLSDSITGLLKKGSRGEDVKKVQEALQELGYEFEKYGADGVLGEETEVIIREFQELNGLEVDGIIGPETLAALDEARMSTGELSGELEELVEGLDEMGGREKLLESIKNIFHGICDVIRPVKMAFKKMIPPITADTISNLIDKFYTLTTKMTISTDTAAKVYRIFKGVFAIFRLISAITGGALKLGFTLLSKVCEAFGMDALEVVASVADLIVTFHDWVFENSIIAKAIDKIIEILPILVTKVGEVKEKFLEWLESFKKTKAFQEFMDKFDKFRNKFKKITSMKITSKSLTVWILELKKSFIELAKTIPGVFKEIKKSFINGLDNLTGGKLTKIKDFFKSISAMPEVEALMQSLSRLGRGFMSLISPITNFVSSVWEQAKTIGSNIIEGLQNGLSEGAGGIVLKIIEVATNLINAFCDMLGIQSPSTVAFSWGKYIIEGLVLGLLAYIGLTSDAGQKIIDKLKEVFEGSKIQEVISSFTDKIDTEKIFAFAGKIGEAASKIDWGKVFLGGISIVLFKSLNDLIGILKNLTNPLEGIGELLKSFGSTISTVGNAYAKDKNREALMKTAIAIGILVAAIAALVYVAGDNYGQVWNAVGVVVVLAGVLVGLSIAMDKLGAAAISFDGKAKSFKLDGLKQSMLSLGIAILLMAVTVKLVGNLDPEEAKQGFIGLAEIMLSILAFMTVSSFIAKKGDSINGFGKTMKQMAVAMLLMLAVIKLASMMDPADMLVGLLVIEAFVLITLQMAVANRIAGGNATKFGKTMKQMAVAMLLMLAVVKLSSMMDPADLIVGFAVIEAFVLIAVQMGIANRIAGGNATKFGGTMLKMAIALGIMAGVVYLLSKMNYDTIIKGVLAIQAFTLLIAEMLLIAKLGKKTKETGSTIVSMAIAIGILAGVCILISAIDTSALAKGIIAVGLLSTFMAGMIYASKGVKKSMSSILMLSVAIGLMTGAVWLLSLMDTTKLATSVAALSTLMVAFGAMTKLSSGIQGSKGLIGGLATMMIVVTMLTGLLWVINILNIQGSIETVASISTLLISLAASCKILSGIQSVSASALIAMGVLTLVVAALAVVLWGIGKLDVQANLPVVISLSVLLLAMSGVTMILGKFGSGSLAAAAEGALAMVVVITILGVFIGALGVLVTHIPEAQQFLEAGIPVLEAIGEGIGRFVGGIIGGIGAGICDQLPGMGEAISEFANSFTGIDSTALDGVKTLAEIIAVIGGAAIVDGIAGLLNFSSESPIEQFKTNAIGLVDAMVEVSNKLSGVEINSEQIEAVAKAGELFATLANSIPSTDGLLQKLTGIKDLGGFGTDIGTFINELKTVNDALGTDYVFNTETFTTFSTVGTAFAELVNSIPATDGWLQMITGVKDLGNFGTDISTFIGELKTINDTLGIDYAFNTEAFTSFSTVGTAFADLVNSIPATDGWLQVITGIRDLGEFGTDIGTYVDELKKVNDKFTDDFVFNEEAFGSLITAGEKMAGLQESLTGIEGVIGWFKGQQNLGDFGTNIGYYADGVAKLASITITDECIESVTKAGEALLALNNTLPEEGWFDSKISMSDFSDYIDDFATALSSFNKTASGLDADGINIAMDAAERIRQLIQLVAYIDVSGVAAFTGVGTGGAGADGPAYKIGQAIAKFSETVSGINTEAVSVAVSAATKIRTLVSNLVGLDYSGIDSFKPDKIGEAIKGYANKVAGIDTSTVSKSISAATRLKSFISGLAGFDNSGLTLFKPATLGTAIADYVNKISDVDLSMISSSIVGVTKLKNFISSLSGLDISGVSVFKTAVSNLASTDISGAVNSLKESTKGMSSVGTNMVESITRGIKTSSSSLTTTTTSLVTTMLKNFNSKADSFQKIGTTFTTNLAKGIKSKSASVSSSATTLVSSAITSVRGYYNSMYNAGTYVGSGLVVGISSKWWSVYNAGYSLGQAAVLGEKAGQQSNSPSKLTIQAGKWIGEGLVIGIGKMTNAVYDSGSSLGETATKSLSSALSNVTDMIDDSLDTNPTIRPVLDLSDVESGVGTISGLFSNDLSIGASANLGAISTMMSQRNQNGTNADVVSAIDGLGKRLNNVGGTSYNINGITYDDGTAVSEAVKTLIRAVKIEGRV